MSTKHLPSLVRAEIIGDDTAVALGISVRSSSPVLAICRELIAAGHHPATPLQAWRGSTLCLIVRSIGEGAALEVTSNASGTPIFKRLQGRVAASAVRPNGVPATRVPPVGFAVQRGRHHRRAFHKERRGPKRRAAS